MDNFQTNPLLVPIFQEVEQIIGKDTFELWFKTAQISYEEPVLTITIPNAVWGKTIRERYQTIITDAFLKHLGIEIQVNYQVTNETTPLVADASQVTPVVSTNSATINPFASLLNSD